MLLWFYVSPANVTCVLFNLKVQLLGHSVACCVLLLFRSIFPAVIPGEQLVSRHVGRFLSGSVPVCPAALLALCLSWDQGSGGSATKPVP